MRYQLAVLAQLNPGVNDAVRPDVAGRGNLCGRIDNRRRMNTHACDDERGLPVQAPRFGACRPGLRLSRRQVTTASQASFAVDVGLALQAAGGSAKGEDIDLDAQLIAGRNRAAEARALNSGEDQQLVVAVGDFGEQQRRAGLRHGFHDQHARHNGIIGKMSAEKRLVDRNILNGDDALGADHLHHAIEQQHGVAMRQQLDQLADVELQVLAARRRGIGPDHSWMKVEPRLYI